MTPELRAEIEKIATDPGEKRVAFFCGRKNMFRGKWLRFSMPPGYIMRFFRPDSIRFERMVNPTPHIDGPHGYLKNCSVLSVESEASTTMSSDHATESRQLGRFCSSFSVWMKMETDMRVRGVSCKAVRAGERSAIIRP